MSFQQFLHSCLIGFEIQNRFLFSLDSLGGKVDSNLFAHAEKLVLPSFHSNNVEIFLGESIKHVSAETDGTSRVGKREGYLEDHPSWIISSWGFESAWYPFDVTRTSCSRLQVPNLLVTDGSMVKTMSR